MQKIFNLQRIRIFKHLTIVTVLEFITLHTTKLTSTYLLNEQFKYLFILYYNNTKLRTD